MPEFAMVFCVDHDWHFRGRGKRSAGFSAARADSEDHHSSRAAERILRRNINPGWRTLGLKVVWKRSNPGLMSGHSYGVSERFKVDHERMIGHQENGSV